ncbi:high affinity nitrate transporter 2.6-like protein, partial [Tanacetum coccineum]
MIELRADVELKDNIVAAMPKIAGEGYYTCNIRVEYEWKPLRCACCNVFGHVLEECPKNIGVGATKNLKKTSQTPKKIPVGQKMGFKPTKQQVYQPVSKKLTANNDGNKKKNVEYTSEINKSNSFDALNSVDNDVELGTNWGSSYLAGQEANYSGSSFWNAESSSPSTTPIIGKINMMENLIIDEKSILVDNEGKPLRKVDDNSEDEVASVDNEMASFLAKKDGYGTQSLLQQWKDSHELDDYEYDLYDDDMYEGQEIPEMLQAFCDNLDIKVRGRKKK